MKRYIFVLVAFVIFPMFLFAQRSTNWKRTRYEIVYGLGGTNFLGELGGTNDIGSDFVKDFELSVTRPLMSVGMRYKLKERLAVKSALSYGWLKGDDALTGKSGEVVNRDDPAWPRLNRNLHFRSPIVEFSTQLEASIIRERIGHRYNLRKVRGMSGYVINTYLFAGIAGFYFNPKAKPSDSDKWVALQPIGTEGQGLMPTREKYSRFQVAIPVGMGIKYGLNRKWSIGLEYGVRKTFTDYIDDVSTTYYDRDAIAAAHGEQAAYLSNPYRFVDPSGPLGEQRGDPNDNDFYMFGMVTLSYKLKTTRNGLPKF